MSLLPNKSPAAAIPSEKQDPKRRALGRGLEVLLPLRQTAPLKPEPTADGKPLEIPVEAIDRNPFQTRTTFDAEKLRELAQSIAATGVVQPIVVRSIPGGRFQLITGERRLMASKQAGKATIPAIVRAVSDEQAMEMTIVENLQRHRASPRLPATLHRLPYDPGADGHSYRQGARLRRKLPAPPQAPGIDPAQS